MFKVLQVCVCVCVFSEQKQAHFRLRNRQTGLMMTVTGDLDDVKLLRIQETEETDGFEQIWFYRNGYLHCKVRLITSEFTWSEARQTGAGIQF